jgi:hypothetical protein
MTTFEDRVEKMLRSETNTGLKRMATSLADVMDLAECGEDNDLWERCYAMAMIITHILEERGIDY